MRDYQLGLYEKAMPTGLPFAQMLSETARGGFDTLEISVDETDARLARLDWTQAERRQLSLACADAGVPIRTMCLSGQRRFPLGSHDADVRARSIAILTEAIRFSADIGIRIIQLAGYDVYYEQGDGDTARRFAENLARCTETAARYGVLMGFETMETPFMDTVGKAMEYVDKIHSPYLGVYPDVGNLQNASLLYGTDIVADIESGKGHILAAHLKETRPNVYRDMDFGTGHTPYIPCLRALYGMGVRHFTGEFWYKNEPDFRATLQSASAFLRERICEAVNA